ncbi:NudC domain-containing protein 1 [Nowakowskiella sp. JEL0407]|nr:NudC domain-containing protein 1 [Nowakowskiella sp. JEL0407]
MAFRPENSKRNFNFEGYKLDFSASSDFIQFTKFPISTNAESPAPINLDKYQKSNTITPFRKLEVRSKWNHLTLDPFNSTPSAVFVDGYERLWYVVVGHENPKFVAQLQIADVGNQEFPSHAFASSSLFVLNSGSGSIHVFLVDRNPDIPTFTPLTTIESTSTTSTSTIRLPPSLLLSSRQINSHLLAIIILRFEDSVAETSNAHPGLGSSAQPQMETITTPLARKNTEIVLELLHITVPSKSVETKLVLRGSAGPFTARIGETGDDVFVISECNYSVVYPVYNPPRSVPVDDSRKEVKTAPKRKIFWQQTQSDITISVRLERVHKKNDISCTINYDCVGVTSLTIGGEEVDPTVLVPLSKRLYGTVVPSDCVWTLEDDGKLVAFQLQKSVSERWVELFSYGEIGEENEFDVEEVVDEQKLKEILKQMEKFTASEGDAKSAVTSTFDAMNEIEDEDLEGSGVILSFFTVSENKFIAQKVNEPSQEWMCVVPSGDDFCVCLRNDVDALVYRIRRGSSGLEIQHLVSLNAFAYVAASKRSKKYLLVSAAGGEGGREPSGAVGVVVESKRNIFVYKDAMGRKSNHGKQSVIDLGDLSGGEHEEVIGVSAANGHLFVLRDKSVIVIA